MRILRTGQRTNSSGFTLVEMLIVVSIIISMTAVLAIWFGNFYASKKAYIEAVKSAGMSDLARNLAEAKGVNYRVTFDPGANTVTLSGMNPATLQYEVPSDVKQIVLISEVAIKSLNTPRSISGAAASGAPDYITFYPDGSSESGFVVLSGAKGEVYTLVFAATTGTVKLLNYEK